MKGLEIENYIIPDLENKTVIVTGGAHGIGKAIALEFVKQKSHVAILDVNEISIKEFTKELPEEFNGRIFILKCDITNEYEVNNCMKIIYKQFHGIDILVNNAGITFNRTLEELTIKEWSRVINTNLTGAFICSKSVMPYMIKKGSGNIIMISSGSAITGSGGSVAYAVSKGGINSLIRALSRELAPKGIRVNGVAPRSIQGDLLKKLYSNKEIETIKNNVPLRRLGNMADVAHAVVFLASRLSGYITGEIILVDGGRTYGS